MTYRIATCGGKFIVMVHQHMGDGCFDWVALEGEYDTRKDAELAMSIHCELDRLTA